MSGWAQTSFGLANGACVYSDVVVRILFGYLSLVLSGLTFQNGSAGDTVLTIRSLAGQTEGLLAGKQADLLRRFLFTRKPP